ncbi:MAG TPA: hypothetical protein VEU47_00795 [Candidatus Cybelea sp.]|nr:hypothetical protein [Candidatus Cybelea sp.]
MLGAAPALSCGSTGSGVGAPGDFERTLKIFADDLPRGLDLSWRGVAADPATGKHTIEGVKLLADKTEYDLGTVLISDVHEQNGKVCGMTIDFPKRSYGTAAGGAKDNWSPATVARTLGYDSVSASFRIVYDFDPEARTLSATLTAQADQLGDSELKLLVGHISPQMTHVAVEQLRWWFKDAGAVDRALYVLEREHQLDAGGGSGRAGDGLAAMAKDLAGLLGVANGAPTIEQALRQHRPLVLHNTGKADVDDIGYGVVSLIFGDADKQRKISSALHLQVSAE